MIMMRMRWRQLGKNKQPSRARSSRNRGGMHLLQNLSMKAPTKISPPAVLAIVATAGTAAINLGERDMMDELLIS